MGFKKSVYLSTTLRYHTTITGLAGAGGKQGIPISAV
jgi:hypothetical protein